MKKYALIVLVALVSMYMAGCAKKQAVEESQEAMTMETLSSMATTTPAAPAVSLQAPTAQAPQAPALPPAGPYKPTSTEIQTALKNAGFYAGEIDGKIGKMSKKAIEDFQQAKGLKADGKVGSKTWVELSKYLNPAPQPAAPSKGKR